MSKRIGDKPVIDRYIGSQAVSKVCIGNREVWAPFLPESDEEFTSRQSGGDGLALVKSIRGRTEVVDGELANNNAVAVETVGFNLWDEEWEAGLLNSGSGVPISGNGLRSKNFIPVSADKDYFLNTGSLSSNCRIFFFDSNYEYLEDMDPDGAPFTAYGAFVKFHIPTSEEVTEYPNDICFNLSNEDRNGTYEPHWEETFEVNLNSFNVQDANGVITTVHGLNGTDNSYDEIKNGKYIKRRGRRAYESGDENDPSLVTDMTNTDYPLASQEEYEVVDYARFLYRVSRKTKTEHIKKIAGRTVSYNQLFRGNEGTWMTGSGIPFTAYDGRVKANGVASVASTASLYPSSLSRKLVVGHKYIVKFKGTYTNCIIRFYYGSYTPSLSGDVIVTATAESDINFAISTFNTTDTVTIDATLSFTDLTQAGLADIITTPEQFDAWQMEQFGHKGYLGYTPGKLVSVNPTGIKTTTPGGDEHTLPLDFTEHFPAGVNGLNGVFDEVVSDENGKFTDGGKRFGVVDLGDLSYAKTSDGMFRANISDMKAPTINTERLLGFVCSKYPADTQPSVSYADSADKTMKRYNSITTTTIFIKDSAYIDATPADFKAAMSGIPLIYELATPQHVTFTDPSDAVYPVTEGGTEQVLPVNGSDPETIAPDFIFKPRQGNLYRVDKDGTEEAVYPDGEFSAPFREGVRYEK